MQTYVCEVLQLFVIDFVQVLPVVGRLWADEDFVSLNDFVDR